MRGGQLDDRITVQVQADVDALDGYGPQPGDWVDVFARIPAQVQDALPSRSETEQNGLRQADRPGRVRLRYHNQYMRGITPAMRVLVHNEVDDIYQIDSPLAEIGRREWIEFTIRGFAT